MSVDVITSPSALNAIANDWNDLWHRDPNATPFQSPHWLLPWWEHFGGGELKAIVTRNKGRLDALAPLYVLRDDDTDESLGLLLGTGISDYLDILLAPDVAADDVMKQLQSFDCQLWDLQQLRPSSPILAAPLLDSWSENVEEQDPCPVLSIGDPKNIGSTHFRKKLRYYRRSLERQGKVSFETATADSLDELLTVLFDLHAARWRQRGLLGVLADDVIQRFHRDVARGMLAAGALRLYALRLDSRYAAVFYGFAHHDTVYYYLSGYDPALERLSIGTVIVDHAIEQAVSEGAQRFDFLRGAEDYKHAWGAEDTINKRRQLIRG